MYEGAIQQKQLFSYILQFASVSPPGYGMYLADFAHNYYVFLFIDNLHNNVFCKAHCCNPLIYIMIYKLCVIIILLLLLLCYYNYIISDGLGGLYAHWFI